MFLELISPFLALTLGNSLSNQFLFLTSPRIRLILNSNKKKPTSHHKKLPLLSKHNYTTLTTFKVLTATLRLYVNYFRWNIFLGKVKIKSGQVTLALSET